MSTSKGLIEVLWGDKTQVRSGLKGMGAGFGKEAVGCWCYLMALLRATL